MAALREVAALALVAVAAATVLPEAGWNATAHYALVESLADGTPRIDRHLNQGGDIAWVDGHFYAAKSPGLALVSLPLYAAFDAAGAVRPRAASRTGLPALAASAPRLSGSSTSSSSPPSSACFSSSGTSLTRARPEQASPSR